MSRRYECNLSREALKKAIQELNEPEDNCLRLVEIDKLKTRFEEVEQGQTLVRTDDAFLLRFLRARKFNQDRALQMLINYNTQRKEWRDLFDLVDNPHSIEDLLSAGPIIPLPCRANNGTFVIIGRPGLGFKGGKDMIKFVASTVLTLEKLLESEEMQIYGVTVIHDLSNFSLSYAMQMASLGKRFFHVVQDAMPMRLKSINMMNEAFVFDIVYSVVSRFMKEKVRQRLQLHGSSFTKLHEIIDPTNLPPFLGGTGPDLNAEEWKSRILGESYSGVLGKETTL